MFDIAVVGTATEDVFVKVPEAKLIRVADADCETTYLALAYGAKITVESLFLSVGGGSTNTAAGLARMGLRTAAVAKIGEDEEGSRVLARLQALGIDTGRFVRTPEFFTGLSVILTGFTGDRTILTHRGASSELTEAEIPWDLLRQVPWLFVGSMSGRSAPLFLRLADFAGEHGLNLALNPGSHQLKMGWEALRPALEHCAVLFLNKEEAYCLTGVAPHQGPRDEQEMRRRLHEAGCRTVFITAGTEGMEASDGKQSHVLPAYKTRTVSTVGAGDAFAAGALTALIRDCDLPTAMRIGALNACSVVQSYGATEGLLTWEQAQAWDEQCQPGGPCPVTQSESTEPAGS
jgi:sugar/nucleoside kinase (ribokinase family)